MDASFIDVPRQRNSREENRKIKNGELPEHWSEAKRRQKDCDARWTKKAGKAEYGYKNHIVVDEKTKLIMTRKTTAANVHDSQVFDVLLTEKDKVVYADSAYVGQTLNHDVKQEICERAYRNHPLSDEQVIENKRKSKHRCRVEHVFGFIETLT
ncbi:Mobile element protein [Lactococcus lactis subsp. lactis]|nr:transposase [Lactococcus lactis]KST91480.1 Mobile element protein [Lactococcus lactis subsp. lactis]